MHSFAFICKMATKIFMTTENEDSGAHQRKDIGARLREERERLGLSQVQLAEAAGVMRNAQGLYESGARSPDGDYFAAVARVGVDVVFVLAGPGLLGTKVTPRELELVDQFRLSSRVVQASVLEILKTTATVKKRKVKT